MQTVFPSFSCVSARSELMNCCFLGVGGAAGVCSPAALSICSRINFSTGAFLCTCGIVAIATTEMWEVVSLVCEQTHVTLPAHAPPSHLMQNVYIISCFNVEPHRQNVPTSLYSNPELQVPIEQCIILQYIRINIEGCSSVFCWMNSPVHLSDVSNDASTEQK